MYSNRRTFPVHLLIPKEFGGGHITEECYEGYGDFGGVDAYSLLARWNLGTDDRMAGIELQFDHPEDIRYPLKFVEHPCAYEDADASEDCPDQGFFYSDTGEEDD